MAIARLKSRVDANVESNCSSLWSNAIRNLKWPDSLRWYHYSLRLEINSTLGNATSIKSQITLPECNMSSQITNAATGAPDYLPGYQSLQSLEQRHRYAGAKMRGLDAMQNMYSLIIIFFLIIFVLTRLLLVISDLSHSFRDFFVFLVCLLVPFNVILAGDLLDLSSISIGFLYQGIPFLDIKTSVLV